MGRPPKYDWEDKRDICYQLHVVQKLSGSQIVKHFSEHFGVPISQLPGVNQFYARFRHWGFPSRKNWFTAEQKDQIVARTRELFNQNLSAQHTLNTLQEEGWDIDRYQFRVLRKKHGMILRSAPGYRRLEEGKKKRKHGEVDEDTHSGAEGTDVEEDSTQQAVTEALLPPEEAARRAQRMVDLQAQSDQLLQTRKRRRRIRGYGHLPPDAPGMQPRYNSETSLDECKAFLGLSNENYVAIREQYAEICREMGIVKMTLCQEGEWQASKDRLVQGNEHLLTVLNHLQPELDKKWNALNCICTDVTKRMRSQTRFVSVADANNILHLNPAESKEIRRILYDILSADQFTSMITCGKERMDELRQQWYSRSSVLEQAVAENDPQKIKALDVLCKDVRKRFCDDQSRKAPGKRQWQRQQHYGPGPGPALPTSSLTKSDTKLHEVEGGSDPTPSNGTVPAIGITPYPLNWSADFRYETGAETASNFDLDPLLSTAIRGPPWPPTETRPPLDEIPMLSDTVHRLEEGNTSGAGVPSKTAAYFRLSPASSFHDHPKVWLGRLIAPTVDSLKSAARAKVKEATKVHVRKVQGIIKTSDGSEGFCVIETDSELNAYLAEAGERPAFVVQLEEEASP